MTRETTLEDLLTPPGSTSRLESGQLLHHHSAEECSGNCCLHGTSPYAGCKYWRVWRADRKQLEHTCPCRIGHPCSAAAAYAKEKGYEFDGTHGCCGIPGHCGGSEEGLGDEFAFWDTAQLEVPWTGPHRVDEADDATETGPQTLEEAHVEVHAALMDFLAAYRADVERRLLRQRDFCLFLACFVAVVAVVAILALCA